MFFFVLRRLLGAIPTLFLLMALTFFLIRVAPGGPFDTDRAWPPEVQANILARYGLDQPVTIQFVTWVGDVLRGDLRESFTYLGRPIAGIIAESLPVSLTLGGLALFCSTLIGIPLGGIAAWKQGTWLDSSAMFLAVAGVSLPSYLIASILILIFSLHLGYLPPALWEGPSSAILPMITLGMRPMAIIGRLTRASMLEAMQADYIRTARGKGVHELSVIFKHALRNSLIPILTILGPLGANLVTGSFLVEMVFQIPGMGKHFVQAVLNRDYPLVMGVTLVYGIVLILSNLFVDLTYAWADPRMQLSGPRGRRG